MTDIESTRKQFEEAFRTIPTDVQFAIRDLITEINEVGWDYTGGCPWRVTPSQFQLAIDVLRIISPSIAGERNDQGTFCVTWTANDFILPDMNNLEEALSPLAAGEPGQLCRSTSGDDAEDETPMYADDDCPSSYFGGR
jgi:hypothetical protein